MDLHLIFIAIVLTLTCMCKNIVIDTMLQLKRNVLNFGYRANFKYKGMLSHSFNRFYVAAKYELPKIKDLKLISLNV